MTLFICTAGTSLMGGPFRPEKHLDVEAQIGARLATIEAECGGDFVQLLVRASAETNALARADCGPRDSVVILASDTADGRACASGVARLVERTLGASAKMIPIAGLQVSDAAQFRQEGIRNLLQIVLREGEIAKRAGERVALNVTGGFKGVVPYLTILGMIEGFETLYVFDQSNALIRLPALPIRFDRESIAFAIPALQVLAQRGVMPKSEFARLLHPYGWMDNPDLRLLIEEADGLLAPSASAELALRGLRHGERKGSIFVHRRARQSGLMDNRLVRRALASISIPDQRSIPLHHSTHVNTDMVYWKTHGPSAPRIFYWIDGEDVFIADILPHDGPYDPKFLNGEIKIWRRDYGMEQFERHDVHADDAQEAEGTDAYGAALSEFVEMFERERERLEADSRTQSADLKERRERIKSLRAQHKREQDEWRIRTGRLERELEGSKREIERLRERVRVLEQESDRIASIADADDEDPA